ncbi:hypothetical protein ILYODFUR_004368 [Ilyodon furcidens]|uniref:Uncharacterized protein n=1 Tax=Ilyodon furcidens TaxID=33524 RepID=A0ABV0U4D3_9TELE
MHCCLAFPWRPIGMRSLVAAACKNRKQSRRQGVKQIHMTPNSVFSPFISAASFLPPSCSLFFLLFYLTPTGLEVCIGKKVLPLLTKAKNSSVRPTLFALPPTIMTALLLHAVLPRHTCTSLCITL